MRRTIQLLLTAAVFVFLSERGSGQSTPAPQILYVMPSGGQAGTSFEIAVTGVNVNEAQGLHFSFPGVKIEHVGSGSAPPVIDPKTKKPPVKPPVGQLSQKFKVTLPANAPLGIQDVRIVTKGGVSNPRAFVVTDTKEFVEKEPNSDVPDAQRVELNSAVSGVINTPTDVDFFLFAGKKGQKVVVSCLASSIDSKLPAEIQLYSIKGSYLGANKAYHGNDALLDAVLPEDGDYYVRVNSFTYTLGGPDYFYRLSIGTAPWIDAVFPSAVEPGKEAEVTVYGRNLPGGKTDMATQVGGRTLEKVTVKVKAPSDARATQRLATTGFVSPVSGFVDGFDFRLKNASGSSNSFLITYAAAPVVVDNDANDALESAQRLTVPCIVAGRIEKKADRDWYAFAAKKGQVLSIEAYGDRIGSPLDLAFRVVDSAGKTLSDQDENPDTTSPQFFTRTEDPPRYRFIAPADGNYAVMVTSRYAFTESGPRHVYVLRVTPEQPDFRLVAMPSSPVAPEGVVVGQGGHQAYTVFAYRQDGFAGDITLSAENLPPGLTVKPQIIPGPTRQGAVVISAAASAPADWTGSLKLIGTAAIDGKKVVREVRAATITWPVPQVTATITRLDREVVLAVRDKAPFTLTVNKESVTVQQGERISVPVKLTRLQPSFNATVNVIALALPPGYVMQPVAFAPGKDTATVNIDGKPAALPGVYSLVFRGTTGPVGPKPPPKPAPNVVNLPSTPVTLIVVPKLLAKLKVPATIAKLPLGKEAELPIELARLYDYDGAYKVELIVPQNVKGIKAKEMTIKPGETSGKLIVQAGPEAKLGPAPVMTVRVTAMFNGDMPIVHETKLTVTVSK